MFLFGLIVLYMMMSLRYETYGSSMFEALNLLMKPLYMHVQ